MTKELKPRQCLNCGRVFYPTHYRQRYCSPICSETMVRHVINQLRYKSGKYYNRWCDGMRKAAERR
jgi:hypothetical protein